LFLLEGSVLVFEDSLDTLPFQKAAKVPTTCTVAQKDGFGITSSGGYSSDP